MRRANHFAQQPRSPNSARDSNFPVWRCGIEVRRRGGARGGEFGATSPLHRRSASRSRRCSLTSEDFDGGARRPTPRAIVNVSENFRWFPIWPERLNTPRPAMPGNVQGCPIGSGDRNGARGIAADCETNPFKANQKPSPRLANAVLTLARDIWVTKQTHRARAAGSVFGAVQLG